MLRNGVLGFYTLAALVLFAVSMLPLELSFLLLCLLLNEAKRHIVAIKTLCGEFSLNIDGGCRFLQEEYYACRTVFFCRHLIILDGINEKGRRRFVLAADAFPADTFRHLSRVCLGLKV